MKLLLSVPLAALAAMWLTSAAVAGGFAVTTLDPLPQAIQAGQTYQIGYMVRQHSVTPLVGGHPAVRISRSGEELRFVGVPEGAPGHYVSTVTFPSAGAWTWVVDQNPFPEPQKLGAIDVQAAPVVAQAAVPIPAQVTAPIPALKVQPPVELAMVALVALLLCAVALTVVQVKRMARPAATTAPGHS
jgi:hypothetical protein